MREQQYTINKWYDRIKCKINYLSGGRSMKYYAIKKGRKTGVFTNWPEAQAQVSGFKGAEYKSFSTKNEAIDYLEGGRQVQIIEKNPNTLLAYVDGSYIEGFDFYGSGVVLLDNKKNVIQEYSFKGNKEEYLSSRNVAGEICATLKAVEYAVENGFAQIVIYYDYEGIEKWFNSSWSTNKPISKDYVSKMRRLEKYIDIRFVKVMAHTGNEFNEVADKLAKRAITSKVNYEESIEKTNSSLSFSEIAKGKSKPALNLLISNHLITEDLILSHFKMIWKKQQRKWLEIKNYKTIFEVKESTIHFEIFLKTGEIENLEITIRELLNGK